MKFSKLFIPTTKEMPSDASLPSHQFLVRGGFIAQTGAGIYDFMPLGKIVLEKIRAIVKKEMDEAGANEVQFGFVTPLSLWSESGRALTMGSELLRFKDRKNGEFVLSPTNEEAVVNMVKNRVTSYKDLPLHLYQINTKFRDEARPRFGLMRGREFLMKDGYSFHSCEEDLVREFNLMEETYKKIYTKLGLDFRVVEADSGAIGGSGSKEFHVLASSGEDTIVVCDGCNYAANIEAAKRLAWFGTIDDGHGWTDFAIGKQPAWIDYMTNYNRTFGSFAEAPNEMFMTLNRRYLENSNYNAIQSPIADATQYIDPSKFNNVFAQTALDAQNFWVQIAQDTTVRRLMSAKIMPNL